MRIYAKLLSHSFSDMSCLLLKSWSSMYLSFQVHAVAWNSSIFWIGLSIRHLAGLGCSSELLCLSNQPLIVQRVPMCSNIALNTCRSAYCPSWCFLWFKLFTTLSKHVWSKTSACTCCNLRNSACSRWSASSVFGLQIFRSLSDVLHLGLVPEGETNSEWPRERERDRQIDR